ncbi:FkbM family methyltransferase [Agathobacter sp.]|uniref:FkbM family methyltransferase n=1 Tax=Agathobacter sp. TaxID=2021311 RepID=UPI002A91019A|nr:FkbM family methyltransferase [Agathobacter sp.]MDY5862420.1 FkbM family methyltransferase [Agathobacter sp.]
MDFESLAKTTQENLYEKFLSKYNQNKVQKIVIFGAGDQGMMTLALLQENGIPVWRFCDNNPDLRGQSVKNIEVILPEDLLTFDKNYIIINIDSYRKEKREQLLAIGIPEDNICTFDIFNPLFKGLTPKYVEEHYQEFANTYILLDDNQSKNTYINYLKGVYTGNLDYYENVACKEEYFPEEIAPKSKNHVFLDVGAYNGNTIEDFIEFAGSYEKIYAFEPFTSSAEIIKTKDFANTEVITAAASDYTGEKDFYCNNYGSLTMVTTILEEGANHEKITLDTVAIDDVLKGQKATFIKMDIEGSELEALHGAEKTIKEYKPFLAICVYHKKEDLITIPSYIKSIVPEYRMYLRLCSRTASDLVLFCKADDK